MLTIGLAGRSALNRDDGGQEFSSRRRKRLHLMRSRAAVLRAAALRFAHTERRRRHAVVADAVTTRFIDSREPARLIARHAVHRFHRARRFTRAMLIRQGILRRATRMIIVHLHRFGSRPSSPYSVRAQRDGCDTAPAAQCERAQENAYK